MGGFVCLIDGVYFSIYLIFMVCWTVLYKLWPRKRKSWSTEHILKELQRSCWWTRIFFCKNKSSWWNEVNDFDETILQCNDLHHKYKIHSKSSHSTQFVSLYDDVLLPLNSTSKENTVNNRPPKEKHWKTFRKEKHQRECPTFNGNYEQH